MKKELTYFRITYDKNLGDFIQGKFEDAKEAIEYSKNVIRQLKNFDYNSPLTKVRIVKFNVEQEFNELNILTTEKIEKEVMCVIGYENV